MSESPETPNQPLLRSPNEETAVNVGPQAERTRSTRAYKVAGITLLACVLIVGQAAIAYFLFSQKSDIKSLQEQNNDLKQQLTNGKSVSIPMRMNMPMESIPLMVDDSVHEERSKDSTVFPQLTQCQMEASGSKPVPMPGFRPVCDESGLYKNEQCWKGTCWCVDPSTGETKANTLRAGPARCNTAVFSAGRINVQPLADVDA